MAYRYGNEPDDTDNLRVFDEDFYNAARQIADYGDVLSNTLESYYLILLRIADEGTRSGAAHDAVEAYLSYVQEIVSVPSRLGSRFKQIANGYINELDQADDYLYEKGSKTVVRDYSVEIQDKLVEMATEDDKEDSWLWKVWDGLRDTFVGWAEDLGWCSTDVTSSEEDLLANQGALMQLKDATKSSINAIFSAVRSVDRKYGNNIEPDVPGGENYFTSAFSTVWDGFWNLEQTLIKLKGIVSAPGEFTAEAIHSKLSSAFQEMRNILAQVDEIVVAGEVSEKQIQKFASLKEAISYFTQYNDIFSDFINGLGGKEAFEMILFNMFDIADMKVRGLLTQEDVEKLYIKQNMMTMLEEMWNVSQFENSDEKAFLDEFKEALSDYKDTYGDFYKWLLDKRVNGKKLFDGRTKEAKRLKELLEGIGNAQKILKYGSEGVELIYKLFTDYSRCADMLDSFVNNYEEGSMMYECAQEIRDLYSKKAMAWANEICNKAVDLGLEAVSIELVKSVSVMAVLQGIRDTIGTVGEITGEGSQSKAMLDAMNYYDIYLANQRAYQNALQKVKDADPDSEGYSALLGDLKNCFEMTKKSMEKTFHAMADASDGTKKAYYLYCERQARKAMMAGNTEIVKDGLNIMSYDNFLKYYNV